MTNEGIEYDNTVCFWLAFRDAEPLQADSVKWSFLNVTLEGP